MVEIMTDIVKQLETRLSATDAKVMALALKEIKRLRKLLDPVSSNTPWFDKAKTYLGLKEWRGSRHNPKILEWWRLIRAPFTDDETPWCAGFVGGVLEEVGIVSTRKANARSYNKWGVKLHGPAVGCIVVFWREKKKGWKGHVGFVVGETSTGQLLVLGGNQGNAVTVAAKPRSRVLSYRWPKSAPLPAIKQLPLGKGAVSDQET